MAANGGMALQSGFGLGNLGPFLKRRLIETLGIVLVLVFIGFPFVVRTLQPVLEGLEADVEEAAACLGANRLQTVLRVTLPSIFPAIITGFALAFARSLGEYGSVVFISGNMPFKTEIAPVLEPDRGRKARHGAC